jgi:hypothetical protein
MADQHTRTQLVENAARRSHVCRKAGLGLLDNSYRVTVTLQNVRYRLPSGTIGKGAVDQNDRLDGRVRRGLRRQSGACEEGQNPAFHSAAPPMFIAKGQTREVSRSRFPSRVCTKIIPSGIVRHEHDDVSNPNLWLKTRAVAGAAKAWRCPVDHFNNGRGLRQGS